MIISAIVARSTNNIIGVNNKLPWHLPGDLKFFQEKTMGHHVIMGRKSFESLPGPLKGRTIIVVTKNKDYYDSSCIIRHSVQEALVYARSQNEEEVLILGGGIIYELTQDLWDKLYITEVEVELKGDTRFIVFDPNKWELVSEQKNLADKKNKYNYTFTIYSRIYD